MQRYQTNCFFTLTMLKCQIGMISQYLFFLLFLWGAKGVKYFGTNWIVGAKLVPIQLYINCRALMTSKSYFVHVNIRRLRTFNQIKFSILHKLNTAAKHPDEGYCSTRVLSCLAFTKLVRLKAHLHSLQNKEPFIQSQGERFMLLSALWLNVPHQEIKKIYIYFMAKHQRRQYKTNSVVEFL